MGLTALLMIDMQNSYVADDGVRNALGRPPIWRLEETIATCTDLLAAARAQGLPVIHSRSTGSAGRDARRKSPYRSVAGSPRLSRATSCWTSHGPACSTTPNSIRCFTTSTCSDSTDGPALHEGALNSLRVLYTEVAPWREILAPDAAWDRAFTTPNYGRDPAYWNETAATA